MVYSRTNVRPEPNVAAGAFRRLFHENSSCVDESGAECEPTVAHASVLRPISQDVASAVRTITGEH